MNLDQKPIEVIDEFVGERLRQRRTFLGLTQQQLAKHIDISYQQLQKYEKGKNRISASKLFIFSQLLNVEVSYFYDGIERSMGSTIALPSLSQDSPMESETARLSEAYSKIKNKEVRDALLEFMSTYSGKKEKH